MNSRFLSLWSLITVAVLMTGCNLPSPPPITPTGAISAVETSVALTLQAIPPATVTPVPLPTQVPPTPTPSVAEVRGRVCYRNGAMTQVTVYFHDEGANQLFTAVVNRPQQDYLVELSPGTYRVYGWPPDFSIGVLYEGGTVTVSRGDRLTGVDICDWNHGPFDVPYPPGYSSAQTNGSISGGIYGYPFGSLPSLTIVAFSQTTPYYYYFVTAVGQTSYAMTNYIPAGTYQVVAYDGSGHAGGCTTNVTVTGGQTGNCDINDWAGSWPAKPSGVP